MLSEFFCKLCPSLKPKFATGGPNVSISDIIGFKPLKGGKFRANIPKFDFLALERLNSGMFWINETNVFQSAAIICDANAKN